MPDEAQRSTTRAPLATYRLQLHSGFNFAAAASIADYLQELGVSHVYSSPYLQAAPGSQHGYDVVDHHRVNAELGGEEAHASFSQRLGECHLGQVLDIVPNHMAIAGRHNQYWWDVLENGPSSRYANYFDIDWQPLEERLRNKVLVPILGDHYGRVIAEKQIQVRRNGGEFYIEYFDHQLPVAPKSLPSLLARVAAEISSDYLAFLSDSLARLPSPTATDRASLLARHRDKEIIRALLGRLFHESPSISHAMDERLERLNQSVDALDDFLERQNYRVAYWKTAGDELMYRRFFDVTTLVGLRVESEHVFADTHSLILDWLKRGVLDGVRIDHPDGLRNPKKYFERLRDAAPDAWIVAEKILERGENLRECWPLQGTTGYEFLNQVGGLFIDSAGLSRIVSFYGDFTGERTSYNDLCREKKHLIMRDILSSDVSRLTSLFVQVCESNRDRRDYTRPEISRGIRELVACFPVYRTYVMAETGEISPTDRCYVDEAVSAAKAARQELDQELFDFLCDVLQLKIRGNVESEFVMRFQQFTGAVMAKGVEDTVFYNYNPLTAANEVGGDPGNPTVSPAEFHAACAEVQSSWPATLLATSTHDTKRSEDVRARLYTLSEIPDRWSEAVSTWAEINRNIPGREKIDRNSEYLLYQTMVGAWPITIDRLTEYMQKATREAKRCTSWISPNEEFESGLRSFIEGIFANQRFQQELERFVSLLIRPGWTTALSQVLLKLTSPGVPDIYQGMELWDLSLVDPDNRRPVDYELRRKLLDEVQRCSVEEILQRSDEGLPKLWTIHQALKVRHAHPELFGTQSTYVPIEARGRKSEHVVAFSRGGRIAAIAPRLVMKLQDEWEDTSIEIPSGTWNNELTGEELQGGRVELKGLLARFPVALLVRGV